MNAEADFDYARLLTVCADWSQEIVPATPAVNAVLERVRQILHGLQDAHTENRAADLVPLLRQVLLQQAAGREAPWLRVPTLAGWPRRNDWEQHEFTVLPAGESLQVQPRWPRFDWLPGQPDLFDDAFAGVASRQHATVPGDPFLQEATGLASYTGHGQREAVRALLQMPAGYTLIANLPTGSGKSLLAQLPPLLGGEGRLTLVVVPTVALALDQAGRMKPLLTRTRPYPELAPLAFYGGQDKDEQLAIRRAIREGRQPVLFTSPESATGSLRAALEEAAENRQLDHIVIDEAHLVVDWGNGFRPAFQLLPALVHECRMRCGEQALRVVLASATLTAPTILTLRDLFGPRDRVEVVSCVHLRPEPRYAFQRVATVAEREERVLEALRAAPRPFILYVTRPDEAKSWGKRLQAAGLRRFGVFHGRTPTAERERLLGEWNANRLDGMVATSAFGLGVDKADVRTIIHATLPESLDRFYQEVGRSGRDGFASTSLLFFTQEDEKQANRMAIDKLITVEEGYKRWCLMIDGSMRDERDHDIHWLNLSTLPAHLQQGSDSNERWNMRTLTLMVRARLIELVALSRKRTAIADDTPDAFDDTEWAAVRLLDTGHRRQDVFGLRIDAARQEVHAACSKGFEQMRVVANGRREISQALADTYRIQRDGVWAPVSACCGGCRMHWDNRFESVAYTPPVAGRSSAFEPHLNLDTKRQHWPITNSRTLLVDLGSGEGYLACILKLLDALIVTLRPHTVAIDRALPESSVEKIRSVLKKHRRMPVFLDFFAPTGMDLSGGRDEVRVLIWSLREHSDIPSDVWTSPCALQLLLVPSILRDPAHTQRRLLDTEWHMDADDLLRQLTT